MSIRPESRTQVVEMTEEIATEAAKLRSVARIDVHDRCGKMRRQVPDSSNCSSHVRKTNKPPLMTTLLCAALLAVQRRITHPFSTKWVGFCPSSNMLLGKPFNLSHEIGGADN